MSLLLFEIITLLIHQLNELRSEVQELAWSLESDLVLLLSETTIELVDRVVNVHHRIDDSVSVR